MTARIKVNMDLEENLADIYVDEADLQDAILNISINSMHAMPDGGELTFRTRHFDLGSDTDIPGLPEGRYCKLTIIDTGIGMDASVKNKIFDPFFSTKGDQGTGLGLSQVFGMIQRSKGAIYVDSEPGNGTEFNMYFRQYNESADSNNNKVLEGAVEVVNEGGAENALRVLLVDDEPALRTLGKEILEASGFRVFVAESASDAMQILEQETVDCLVSDIIMPEVDGFKLAQQVNEKYPQIKTLLVSGYNDQADNDELRRKYTILQKPYKARDLIKSINNL